MLNFFIYFKDFHLKIKCYKTQILSFISFFSKFESQNNRKFKQKIDEKSIKIFTTLLNCTHKDKKQI